ncbi:MAG: response regulator [Planctomycetes bacterium]|nr:response regulator [Planctomycetota bacterium]
MPIRTLIVDDEPLARERIQTLLEEHEDFDVVGECSNGQEGVAAIRQLSPDLVFLDIQMPELDGFEVLEQLEDDELPCVVFCTAYDDHAVKAFEVHALDYLLKPIDRERFATTVQRIRSKLGEGIDLSTLRRGLLDLIEGMPTRSEVRDRLVVKSEGRVIFVNASEIDWIEAAGNYARLHVGEDSHLIRETMIGLERKLDADTFVRIHRSAIVNVQRIREMQPLFHGEYLVVLESGTQLTLSRGYRDNLQRILGDTL